MKSNETIICGLDEIDEVVQKLKQIVQNKNIIVLLQGDLASGKTTLVKEFVKTLGYKDLVTSPTFSLQSIYGEDIFHYDIYNKTLSEFVSLGMLEEFEKKGLHFVEWGDDSLKKILDEYQFENIKIKIKKINMAREYQIET